MAGSALGVLASHLDLFHFFMWKGEFRAILSAPYSALMSNCLFPITHSIYSYTVYTARSINIYTVC